MEVSCKVVARPETEMEHGDLEKSSRSVSGIGKRMDPVHDVLGRRERCIECLLNILFYCFFVCILRAFVLSVICSASAGAYIVFPLFARGDMTKVDMNSRYMGDRRGILGESMNGRLYPFLPASR